MSVTSTTLAATYRGGRTTASVALTSLLYVLSLSTATGLTARSSCEKVADVFSKKIGRSPEVPSLVIPACFTKLTSLLKDAGTHDVTISVHGQKLSPVSKMRSDASF
ncbi:hypothetical protein RRG08_034931 [Elysia crispata]|uniref:Uncharacterized protein n=1 Tax=Elysia crispata TaxID=231223 RepID=A0AAE0Y2I1_9GAST|nr:hypothetical protein RRG08_034931 [Elysia crispata]